MLSNPAYREMYMQTMQNPQTRQMMLQMMRNPAFMQQMMQNLPPSLRQSIGDDPEALSRMVGEREERERERERGRGRERKGSQEELV